MHGHLAHSGIRYGSEESLVFTDIFMEALNYNSLKASVQIAKERGETFLGYEKSDYANGKYFDKYRNKGLKLVSEKVQKALGNVPQITKQQWNELEEDVKKYGVFHSYRLAIAP